jgi:multidrug efflux pump subunit AcrA (membrane-fusion protein)
VAVGFTGEEGHPHEAKLDLIAPEVDPRTGTVRFRATVANPKGLLLPGMSARVRLTPSK